MVHNFAHTYCSVAALFQSLCSFAHYLLFVRKSVYCKTMPYFTGYPCRHVLLGRHVLQTHYLVFVYTYNPPVRSCLKANVLAVGLVEPAAEEMKDERNNLDSD